MSRPKNKAPTEPPVGPDDAFPVKSMALSGVVRTSKGYAVAVVTLSPDGEVLSLTLGRSQVGKQYVAAEHKNVMVAEALRA